MTTQKIYCYWLLLKEYNDTYYEIIAGFRRKWEVISVKEKLDNRFYYCHYISDIPLSVEKKNMEMASVYLIHKNRIVSRKD